MSTNLILSPGLRPRFGLSHIEAQAPTVTPLVDFGSLDDVIILTGGDAKKP